jgi:hypothetical protein
MADPLAKPDVKTTTAPLPQTSIASVTPVPPVAPVLLVVPVIPIPSITPIGTVSSVGPVGSVGQLPPIVAAASMGPVLSVGLGTPCPSLGPAGTSASTNLKAGETTAAGALRTKSEDPSVESHNDEHDEDQVDEGKENCADCYRRRNKFSARTQR